MRPSYIARTGAAAAAFVFVTGCAATTGSRGDGSPAASNLLTRAELASVSANNAYEAIERLRPQWLRPRGPTSVTQPEGDWPLVYMDNVRAGDVSMLPNIPVDDIGEIRFITGSDATTRWGTGVTGGVIEIISLKRMK